MAELYTQLRKPDLAREHTEQAEWARKGPIGRVTSHQLEAKKAITNGNPQDAISHLNQAAEQWESREGQEAWDRLGTEKRANWCFLLANAFIQAGDNDRAAQFLEKANGQWEAPTDDVDRKAWNDLGNNGRAAWCNKLADLYEKIGNNQKAEELREEANLTIQLANLEQER
ncbi:MAG: hypothetical protein LBD60_02710 [Puniceicoccales bacterium]|jgi:uncharacterized protein HemY|nr:hypothetical protein [Puniceicoccales bacterium]